MKPRALGFRLIILGVLSLAVAACAPGPGASSITPVPTPAGPARPPTASPTLPPPTPTASPVPRPPTPTPAAVPSAPPFTLVIMHTNDVRGYTEPCG
jgi:2',3'-cyclic-nucleotide 2'-phosphodiesterase (5'-nucleotidase family)